MSLLQLPTVWNETLEHADAMWVRPEAHGRDWMVLFVGLLAIFLDGATTFVMVHLEPFSEANGTALATMNVLGTDAYVILAASVSLLFITLWLVRGPGLLARVLPWFALSFIAVKLLIGAQNLVLWTGLWTNVFLG